MRLIWAMKKVKDTRNQLLHLYKRVNFNYNKSVSKLNLSNTKSEINRLVQVFRVKDVTDHVDRQLLDGRWLLVFFLI